MYSCLPAYHGRYCEMDATVKLTTGQVIPTVTTQKATAGIASTVGQQINPGLVAAGGTELGLIQLIVIVVSTGLVFTLATITIFVLCSTSRFSHYLLGI